MKPAMSKKEIVRKAGFLQIGSMTVFCLAALLGTYALIKHDLFFASINGILMLANLGLYQFQSKIIRDNT